MQGCHESGRFWVHYADLLFHKRGGGMAVQRVHLRGPEVMSEICKVGYSATLARAHVHNLIYYWNRGHRIQEGTTRGQHTSAGAIVCWRAALRVGCCAKRIVRGPPSRRDLCT